MQGAPGKLFYFYKDPYRKVPVFLSGSAPRCVLWVGGQTESFFTINYFEDLTAALNEQWSFAQVELPSSHIGYGAQDHVTEAEDVDQILGLLRERHGMSEVTLFATSTGVQVALQLLAEGPNAGLITRVILHGFVADPATNELFSDAAVARRGKQVEALMAADRREDMQAMAGFYDLPVTPARLSLGGFPTLLEALWLPGMKGDRTTAAKALGCIAVPTLILLASHSQYEPAKNDIANVTECAKRSLGCAETDAVVTFLHDTCDEKRRLLKVDTPRHVSVITAFLTAADDKRANRQALEAERARIEERHRRIALDKLMCS